jgi:regulator of protease activity HflC (stomatin/prohibitin superfamily)
MERLQQGRPGGMFGYMATAFVVLIVVFTMWSSWFTIDQRERGAITTFGKLTRIAEPGLGFKIPYVNTLTIFDIGTQNAIWDGANRNVLHVYSKDQQPAEVSASVTFRVPVDRIGEVYSKFGSLENLEHRILIPRTTAVFKNVFGGFTAVSAVQERPALNKQFQDTLIDVLEGEPIVVESAQITNIDFSDAYENSIEQRMQAEVEVQKLRQNAEREKVRAQIIVTQAQAKADAVRAEAQAQSEAIRLKGDAEASAIRARGAALAENPSLVGLVQAERWDGKLPSTMVPGSALPMINVAPNARP